MKKYLYVNIAIGCTFLTIGIVLICFCIAMSLDLIILIVAVVMIGVGLLLGIPPIIKIITVSSVMKKGVETMGEYVSAATDFKILGVAVYYIEVLFKTESGEVITAKTAPHFSFFDTQCYEKMRLFTVKVYKNNVEIIQPIDTTVSRMSGAGDTSQDKYDCDDAISNFRDSF